MLFSEHEQDPPPILMQRKDRFTMDMNIWALQITQALKDGDNEALAQAIEDAEQHQLVVHAARMRIVLANRTGSPQPLEQARPVLERLEDRFFLRRLHEVEARIRQA